MLISPGQVESIPLYPMADKNLKSLRGNAEKYFTCKTKVQSHKPAKSIPGEKGASALAAYLHTHTHTKNKLWNFSFILVYNERIILYVNLGFGKILENSANNLKEWISLWIPSVQEGSAGTFVPNFLPMTSLPSFLLPLFFALYQISGKNNLNLGAEKGFCIL